MSNGRRIDRTWFHKKAVKRFSLFGVHLCLWIIPILISGTLCAQTWTKLHTFDGHICLAKFLNANTGFVGIGTSPGSQVGNGPVALYKTTDGGTTWSEVSIPSGYSGEIGDILMVDSLHGWLAMAAYRSGNSALWRTNDAGLTWNETQLAGCGTSVTITPSTMIVTDINNRGHISTDGGNTFSDGFLNSTNCVDFVDPLHGVISDFRGENWLYSSDGGLSWQNSNMTIEAWSVYSDSGTPNFYAAPEGSSSADFNPGTIYHSTDYGITWGTLANFPFVFSGHLTGLGGQYLFFQVMDVRNTVAGVTYAGFYYSTDQGLTWTSIGGPCALNDTRFSVLQGCGGFTIYGFDDQANGSLFEYSIGSGSSNPQMLHPESASAYYGQIDTLTLGVDISQINLDSLWPYIGDILAAYSWDSSLASYAGYIPPSGWFISSVTHTGNTADIDIQNSSSAPSQPLNLGIALFRPRTTQLSSSWVTLSSLVLEVGSEPLSLCVTDNEDNHWALKTLGALSGVNPLIQPLVQDGEEIVAYPNPAGDELFVRTANPSGTQIVIYDAIGRPVASGNAIASSTASIDIHSLARGSYTLVCHIGDHTITRNISKVQ